jgi:hypothetical protein
MTSQGSFMQTTRAFIPVSPTVSSLGDFMSNLGEMGYDEGGLSGDSYSPSAGVTGSLNTLSNLIPPKYNIGDHVFAKVFVRGVRSEIEITGTITDITTLEEPYSYKIKFDDAIYKKLSKKEIKEDNIRLHLNSGKQNIPLISIDFRQL